MSGEDIAEGLIHVAELIGPVAVTLLIGWGIWLRWGRAKLKSVQSKESESNISELLLRMENLEVALQAERAKNDALRERVAHMEAREKLLIDLLRDSRHCHFPIA